MSASEAELSELKEWLTHEVKLERYFEKLSNYGFSSLTLIQNIEESDLDSVGITPPYHRKRLLKFCKDLQMKQLTSSPHVNTECVPTENSTIEPKHCENKEHGIVMDSVDKEGENSPPPLPPKSVKPPCDIPKVKPVVPDRESSLPDDHSQGNFNMESITPTTSATADSLTTNNNEAKDPVLEISSSSCTCSEERNVRKTVKTPPPIPRRADLDSDIKNDQENEAVSFTASKGESDDVIIVSNGQNDPVEDRGSSEDLGSDTPSQMPYVPENTPKPRPKPRKTSSRKSQANQTTPSTDEGACKNVAVDGDKQHIEHAKKDEEHQEPLEKDDESIYGNWDEYKQAVTVPHKVLEKPTNKKPQPAPRKSTSRHSVAVPDRKKSEEEENTIVINPIKQTQSLHRAKKFPPALPESEKPRLTSEGISVTNTPGNLPESVSPTYEVIGVIPKDNGEPCGTYEGVEMPLDRRQLQIDDNIYEPIFSDVCHKKPATASRPKDSKPREAVHPSKLMSVCGEDMMNKLRRSMVDVEDPSKRKESANNVMCSYESDESTDGLLLDEPPELPEERKPRTESTDSLDGKHAKSGTSKSRKTSGYLFKQGGQQNNRGWKKRWFVFDGKELRYYRSEDHTQESLHVIPVSQMTDIEYDKESKKGRFNLKTANRVFMLSSDSMTDTNLWAQTLLEAILMHKADDSIKKTGGIMSDPDKEGWLKKQGHNVMGDWKRRYVAIKDAKICYFDTYEDFTFETPIHCIDAKLASVKQEGHKSRFLVVTPYKAFSFQAENEFETASWISTIQTAIQMGLSDHSVINKVWSNPANKKCGDCGRKDPVWAAVNYCMCMCAQCIGIHRSLSVKYSKPRSLLMDEKIWNKQLLELMLKIGNENANKLLEFRIPEDDRITPDSDNEKRMEFIFSKYKDMKYMKISEDYGKPEALGQSLQRTVVTEDILKTMELLINRADVKYTNADSEVQKTPLDLAKDAGQELQAELLRQNGADAIDEPPPPVAGDSSIELTPQPPPADSPEKTGFLLLMRKKYWFTLKDRHLKYFRNQGDKDPSGVIDLATMTSLELHASEDTRSLDIVTLDKTYTLKGESDEELEQWYTVIRNKQVFNVQLSFQELGSDRIPHLVAHCLQFVETYGLQAEGIYRVNGNQAKIRALKQAFNQDASRVMLTLDDYSVHDVTGTLKKFLRELPDPVFPDNMYKMFIMVARNPDHDTKLYAVKDALVKLPKVNYDTLKRIVGHLKKVIADQPINRMGIENVSMIFGPTLMSNEKTGKMDDSSINQEFKIIGDLIHYYEWFFDVDDKEIEKDKLMEEARKKIIQIQVPGGDQGGLNQQEFTLSLDIYVQKKNDNSYLTKVAAGMTAGELCMNVIQKKDLAPETNWALFEVIGKLNLERAMQLREKVLSVVLAWEAFGEIRKENYLIIKENHIAESIQPFVGTTLTLDGQLHIREPKRKDWKLSTVMLKNGYMAVDKSKSFFKTIKSDKSDNDQWSLHNLVVFLGVPVEKSTTKGVDTSAGFTVVVKTDLNGNLIRYLCAKDKTDMYRWVAAILNMKHPEGIWTDPTAAAEMKRRRVKDKQVYLGRQSRFLRNEGSSKHIADEIKIRHMSLRRSGPNS